MKLQIYSVAERRPPLGEEVMRWEVESGEVINTPFFDEAHVAVADEQDKPLLDETAIQDMEWRSGGDMHLEDLWSHCILSKGE